MKNILSTIGTWVLLGIIMTVFQILGMTLGLMIFPSDLMNEAMESEGNPLVFFLTCLLNAGAIYYFVKHSNIRGWKLVLVIFTLGFGLMYFMSQIETLWFNESVKFPLMGLYGIVTGGAIMFGMFAIFTTWITGNFKKSKETDTITESSSFQYDWKRIILIAAVAWPLLYWLAGYFIAWQFEDIRVYYSGSSGKEPIQVMFADYINSGLYLFQIFRGFIWVFLAILVLKYMDGSKIQKGFALVMMLVFLCCIQLLIENPFMPEAVRMGHLVETCTENAILGVLIVWLLDKSPERSHASLEMSTQAT